MPMTLNELADAMEKAFAEEAVRKEVAGALSKGKAQDEIVAIFGNNGGLKVKGVRGNVKVLATNAESIEALVRFKLWMAVDILELEQKGKLTNTDNETHGIYGAYKADYDELVAARAQDSSKGNGPLTAICTLVYFVDPKDGVEIPTYPDEINKGKQFAQLFKTNQTDMACNALVGMLIRKRSEGKLKHLSPDVKVSLLMNNIKSEQGHKISLAAVWTKIPPRRPIN